MRRIMGLLLTLAVLSMAGMGCNDSSSKSDSPSSGPDASTGTKTPVEISGSDANITTTTTWTSDNCYTVTTGRLDVTAPLIIEPGTVIKFPLLEEEAAWYSHSIYIHGGGAIIARGKSNATIVFTSYRDDAHGGDTDGDMGAIDPAPGDWAGIRIESGGSVFENCQFLYGGNHDHPALIFSGTFGATVRDSIFAHNGTIDSIDAPPALDVANTTSATVVTGNTFYDNMVPLWIGTPYSFGDTNSFDNSDETPADPQPNKYNGVFVKDGDGHDPDILSAITWSMTKVPFVIHVLWVDAALTISPDVTIKLLPYSFLDAAVYNHNINVRNPGSIKADGTASAPIIFTSIKDDENLGDTNGDGASSGAAGDWAGIGVKSNGTSFRYCQFLYAGNGASSAIMAGDNGTLITGITIANSIIAHTHGTTESMDSAPALDAHSSGAGTIITGNTFFDNVMPIAVSVLFPFDDSNMFDNSILDPLNPLPNIFNGVFVRDGDGHTPAIPNGAELLWSLTKVPFVIGGGSWVPNMEILDGGLLSLGDGSVVKFMDGVNAFLRIPDVDCLNFGPNNNAIFTSILDPVGGMIIPGVPGLNDWDGIFSAAKGGCLDWLTLLLLDIFAPGTTTMLGGIFHNSCGHMIHGTVTQDGVGVVDAVVYLTGDDAQTARTAADGRYTFTVSNGSYTVNPEAAGFSPTVYDVVVEGENVGNLDFSN